jgi:hypothetical protein
LSLDLDNQWSYLKTHGDPSWRSLPSYLDVVVPRILDFLAARRLTITVFVVGQDAAQAAHHEALGAIAQAGHEIGNHSYHHEPWLHLYSREEIERELSMAEEAIERATGRRPVGFRGPGFSLSPAVLDSLARRGYHYDASTLPTFLGPLARAYYFMTARLTAEERAQRKALFGGFAEGLRPLTPHRWSTAHGALLEIPVTTLPVLRVPIHVSYLLYLSAVAPKAALAYFRTALALCRLTGVQPSLLLHALDFLGREDTRALDFFPAMRLPRERKLALVGGAVDALTARFDVLTLERHAAAARARALPSRRLEAAATTR